MCTVSLTISDGCVFIKMMMKYFINTFNGCVLPHNSCFTMAVNSSVVCVGSKDQLYLFSFLAT